MTAKKPQVIPALAILFAIGLFPSKARAEEEVGALRFRLDLDPRIYGNGLPGHPTLKGEKQTGTVGRMRLIWTVSDAFTIEAGVLGRLPFADNISKEAGALPILSFILHPWSSNLSLVLGTLDIHHGYHPAVLDELRYAYGREFQETYNRSLVPAAQKDLGGDPFMPSEQGVQIIAKNEIARVEGYLDWQLLETAVHREKFAVGLLGELDETWFRLGLQFRLVHYGGQIFTASDPIRFAGLDPVRQPITGAITACLVPPLSWIGGLDWLKLELPFAYVHGHLIQMPGGAPENMSGVEGGADLFLFDFARLGYRLWAPIDRDYGFVSEDGDPVYAGRRSHRAIVGFGMPIGPVRVDARLDLVFADQANQLQYETFTLLSYVFETQLANLSGR
jgi:hypothetical protein